MAKVELIMPKMGESIMEATIIKWHKSVGDTIAQDETILEIATDKVDSEIPSPVGGKIVEIFFKEDDIVDIGTVIALIATEGEEVGDAAPPVMEDAKPEVEQPSKVEHESIPFTPELAVAQTEVPIANVSSNGARSEKFISPLVRNIAKEEGIAISELETMKGSGLGGRITKDDIQQLVSQRKEVKNVVVDVSAQSTAPKASTISSGIQSSASLSGQGELIEMDRMRKMIADHMVMSKKVSPHVTSFVEADVTNLVNWREKNKDAFQRAYGEKITFTPLFLEAITQALKEFPRINASVVDEHKILVHKQLNIGMATALPSGNLIVPVIKNADLYNLAGLTKLVNEMASRARENKLKPDEIKDGTFTVTNVGTFGNVMGTPIINQPQAAILALGAIRKKPAVIETEYGDVIAIRQMMFMSLSYDHRIIDGFLGGSFLRRIGDILESFDQKRSI